MTHSGAVKKQSLPMSSVHTVCVTVCLSLTHYRLDESKLDFYDWGSVPKSGCSEKSEFVNH